MTEPPPYPGDLLEHLRAFDALARLVEQRTRSAYARAAQAVALDVSVLRRRMHTLETYTGAPLLSGHGAGLALTPAGAHVLMVARKAVTLTTELRAGRTQRDRLRVACTGAFLSEILPTVLRRLRAELPDLELQVSRRGSHACLALLRDGELDVAIVRSGARPVGLSAAFVGKDRFFVALARKSALAARKKLTGELLAREPLIGYTLPSFTMERVSRVLAPLGATPWIDVQGKAAALAYVAEGLGIAFVSALQQGDPPSHRGVVMRNVTSLFPPASFWLVWRARVLSTSESTFIAEVQRRTGTLPTAAQASMKEGAR